MLSIFSTLTLKQIFLKTKTFFKKLEHCFLVERTKIEKASFPYETAKSEANVTTNRMVTTKWAYHRKQGFTSNYFFFESFVSVLNVPTAQTPILVLFLSAGVLFDGAFSLWVSLIWILRFQSLSKGAHLPPWKHSALKHSALKKAWQISEFPTYTQGWEQGRIQINLHT